MSNTEKQDLLTHLEDVAMMARAMIRDVKQGNKPTKLAIDATQFSINQVEQYSK